MWRTLVHSWFVRLLIVACRAHCSSYRWAGIFCWGDNFRILSWPSFETSIGADERPLYATASPQFVLVSLSMD